MIESLVESGSLTSEGIVNSLLAAIAGAQAACERDLEKTGDNKLGAFINHIQGPSTFYGIT